MSGWFATAVIILAFLAIAVFLIRCSAKRWWEYLIVLALAGLLIVPLYRFTGDVSAFLPDIWSDNADGKDQIIIASVAATLLWPIAVAAIIVFVTKWVIGRNKDAGIQ
jgi:cell shape-determining protein MreD